MPNLAMTAVVCEPHGTPYLATIVSEQHGYTCVEFVHGHTLTRRWVRVQYITRRDDVRITDV